MENKKLNLGLMDDIQIENGLKQLDEWADIIPNNTNNNVNPSDNVNNKYQCNNRLYQSRLDNFIDINHKTNNKLNNRPKKLFQNLNDFNFQKELRIKIFGVGGAGNNMVKFMALNSNIKQESLFAINTDYQVLKTMPNDINLILIGNKTTNGYGSGSNPEIGRESALESEEIIREMLEDTDLLFIVSGMGKGTGTGASPIIAKIAKEMNILTLGLVNLPSISNEGKLIFDRGYDGLKKLKKEVSGILTISNEKLFNETSSKISLEYAFNYANSVISNVISDIINLITIPSEVNVDFNDVRTFFKEPSIFQLNTFDFKTHDDIQNQIEEQLKNLIYQDNIAGAKKVIANFKLNPNVSRDIISNITKALIKITKNDQLEITIGIDYFENIECARVSILLAMNKTEDEYNQININDYKKPATIQLDIINTKDDISEKTLTTVELTTNQLHHTNNFSKENHQYIEMIDTLNNFADLQKELDIAKVNDNEKDSNILYNQKQEIRRNYIPTKKLKDQEPKTIQFEYKTGPRDY